MIAQIQGRLVEKTPTDVVIDCHGVGYQIHISLHTFSQLPESENIKLYTYLQIKEDAHSLYGFAEKKERELFKLLISVSGVGAGTARTMLSSLAPEQIIQAIKDIGEKEQDFTIDDRVDMSKYPRMGRKYSGREFNTRTPNISVKYNIYYYSFYFHLPAHKTPLFMFITPCGSQVYWRLYAPNTYSKT